MSWLLRAVLAILRLLLLLTFDRPPHDFDRDSPAVGSYDFIVVGAGAAGCIVAARLSETGAKVLLLEEGPSASLDSAVPKLAMLQSITDRIRTIPGKPQNNTRLGYEGRIATSRVGRVMGGGSSVNGVVYVRGNRHDYDHWRDLGNDGWDYDSILPYFKKTEDFRGLKYDHTDKYHGKDGPLHVVNYNEATKLMKLLEPVAEELNLDVIDPNGPTGMGFAPVHLTLKDGVRHSASESFLVPVIQRQNLHILPGATVTKVLFSDTKKVQGVEYNFRGQTYIVEAMKEVVISAGAVFTPKLLMQSGIGPAKHLQQFGIPVVADVAGVGQNLDNHVHVERNIRIVDGIAATFGDILSPSNIFEYLRTRTGFFSEPLITHLHTYLNLGNDSSEWPDVDLYITPYPSIRPVYMIDEIYDELFAPRLYQPVLNIRAMLARPLSRGTISLKSADPADLPVIDHNIYHHPEDMKLQVKALREVSRIVNTEAMKKIRKPEPELILSRCSEFGNDTDSYWECYARHLVEVDIHLCCTAKMGPESDPMRVVSSTLKVRGVEGLRVVDASVMPRVPVANTMATVYMIAEKASDVIKQEWGFLSGSCSKDEEYCKNPDSPSLRT